MQLTPAEKSYIRYLTEIYEPHQWHLAYTPLQSDRIRRLKRTAQRYQRQFCPDQHAPKRRGANKANTSL